MFLTDSFSVFPFWGEGWEGEGSLGNLVQSDALSYIPWPSDVWLQLQPGLLSSLSPSHLLQAATASSHIGLSVGPPEDSLIRFKGRSLLFSWASGFSSARVKRSNQGMTCGGHKASLGPGKSSKVTPALGALFWPIDGLLLDLPDHSSLDLAGDLHQLAITNALLRLVVYPQLLSAEIPRISGRYSFGQSLLKWPQANILMMDMNPSFSLGSWDLYPATEGSSTAFKGSPALTPWAASDSICLAGILRHGADISPQCLSERKNLPLHETWGEGNTVLPCILTPIGEVSIRSKQRNFHKILCNLQ